MTREEKNKEIEVLLERLENSDVLYITDIEGLNAEQTSTLRRTCYKAGISLNVVKNTLLKKAMERSSKDFEALYPTLKGSTSIMFAEAGNAPARMIKDLRKKKLNKPVIRCHATINSYDFGRNTIISHCLLQIMSLKSN